MKGKNENYVLELSFRTLQAEWKSELLGSSSASVSEFEVNI